MVGPGRRSPPERAPTVASMSLSGESERLAWYRDDSRRSVRYDVSVSPRRRYRLVDFAAARQPGFRNHLVPASSVEALVERYGAYECYASVFFFPDDALLYAGEHRVDGRPSIAGYDGKVWAAFLPLDLDAPHPEALDQALDLARIVYRRLLDRWHLPPEGLHCYFSGAKGFHLLVDARVFGRVTPSGNLNRVFSRLRLEIRRFLPDDAGAMLDPAIADKVRLLRLPHTRHRKSGLYKVALSEEELFSLSAAEIRAVAARPRPSPRVVAGGLLPAARIEAVPEVEAVYGRALAAVRRMRGPHPYRMAAPPGDALAALCAARRAMWDSPIAPGRRNNVAIRLASAFRLAGYAFGETRDLLLGLNQRQSAPLPAHEIDSVARSAYARPFPYAYGCHDELIRAFCPFVDRLDDCDDYRESHPRSGRSP